MQKRWLDKESGDPGEIEKLKNSLNVSELVSRLLIQRGMNSFDAAKEFFRPSLEKLHDPYLMKDMDLAITRIQRAGLQKEKILIYGDYDVDGTTAVSLVYSFFNSLGFICDYYIPDRYSEGYGISFKGIDFASDNGFSLIIALDCGIKSNDKIDYANERSIDFIICDHHRPGIELPNAVAVLDPKRDDCNYPYKELSGCGIGFKLIQAYALKNNIPVDTVNEYLDLVAVSIAADIVPITGENRILTYYGLQQISNNPRKGIKAMLEISKAPKTELTVMDLVFKIAPRINAAGRIESGKRAVELLISECDSSATIVSGLIDVNNSERKSLDAQITIEALQMIEENVELIQKKSTVLYNAGWHKGVIGIVASRLTEKYYRPTIVLTESNGYATGSARSVRDFDVYNAIEACSDLLHQFGGHKYAAGLTLPLENVGSFISKFEEVVSSTITDELLIPVIEVDSKIEFTDIDDRFYRIVKQFAPFGPGNMMPVFQTDNVTGFGRIVGSNHLKLDLIKYRISFSAIGFNQGPHLNKINQNVPFSICYSIEENEWNGITSLQLNIKDIRF